MSFVPQCERMSKFTLLALNLITNHHSTSHIFDDELAGLCSKRHHVLCNVFALFTPFTNAPSLRIRTAREHTCTLNIISGPIESHCCDRYEKYDSGAGAPFCDE